MATVSLNAIQFADVFRCLLLWVSLSIRILFSSLWIFKRHAPRGVYVTFWRLQQGEVLHVRDV